ncbi:S8 family serine peptidase [Halocatena pleomorpha]|uniref:Twin-arginine translocation signal domain-containing protein n=1 Tax=Halocatena pleomorpha TaxID=1785090 RepID=A0A3P3RJJ6_9EURY|nr:S8 family serine peptidase [Halocatena pleomorpha]RRJ33545.1 twin-arginine translocation signal domain-containing protein [Halocatena pleomorpha]
MADTIGRRGFLKTLGVVGAGTVFGVRSGEGASGIVDATLDTTTSALQEALVVFESNAIIDEVLGGRVEYYAYDVLPLAYIAAGGGLLQELAALDGVVTVRANRELEYHNADAREITGTNDVQAGEGVDGYDGSSTHVAVIDSGVDGDHPDLSNVENNYQWVGNPFGAPTLWAHTGSLDTDTLGHGTHVTGTIGGDGSASAGRQRGHAPGASLTAYSAGVSLSILKASAAYDHLLATHSDVQIVSNSFGSTGGEPFDPTAPMNVATKQAYDAGILPVFSAGNAGPDSATLNPYAKAPYVLGVGATNDQRQVTEFSSRGDPNGVFDRQRALSTVESEDTDVLALERIGVGAPGNAIVSTVSPTDTLNLTGASSEHYYTELSGTSMSCPCVSGIAALLIDAYQQNGHGTPAPIDVLNTIEATAITDRSEYTASSIGAGFVDSVGAVSRAESGDLADFEDVTLAR